VLNATVLAIEIRLVRGVLYEPSPSANPASLQGYVLIYGKVSNAIAMPLLSGEKATELAKVVAGIAVMGSEYLVPKPDVDQR
jgi:hypothetical protein